MKCDKNSTAQSLDEGRRAVNMRKRDVRAAQEAEHERLTMVSNNARHMDEYRAMRKFWAAEEAGHERLIMDSRALNRIGSIRLVSGVAADAAAPSSGQVPLMIRVACRHTQYTIIKILRLSVVGLDGVVVEWMHLV